jgi:hypothetical protein
MAKHSTGPAELVENLRFSIELSRMIHKHNERLKYEFHDVLAQAYATMTLSRKRLAWLRREDFWRLLSEETNLTVPAACAASPLSYSLPQDNECSGHYPHRCDPLRHAPSAHLQADSDHVAAPLRANG